MVQACKMRDGGGDPRTDIHQNTRQPLDVPVDQNQRTTRRMSPYPTLVKARRGQNETFDLRRHLGEKHVLTVRLLIRVAQENGIALVIGVSLRGSNKRWEEGVGNIRDDEG